MAKAKQKENKNFLIYPNKIRELRTDNDLKQSDIAKLLTTSSNQVGKYERGEQDMNIRHLITLARYYGVSADFILGLPEGLPYGKSKTKKRRENK